jgi:hypothetical protein
LINECDADCFLVCFSGWTKTGGGYCDIDMIWYCAGGFAHRDGTPYEDAKPAG